MTDTTRGISRIQFEIMLSKTETERFIIGDEIVLFGRRVVESSIRQKYPEISDTDLKIEVFKRCYSSFFSPDELQKIILSMKAYWNLKVTSANSSSVQSHP